jgi:hypothetical protein
MASEGRAILLAVNDTDACQLMLQWVLDSDVLLPGDKLHLLHITVRDTTGSNNLPGADYFEQVGAAGAECSAHDDTDLQLLQTTKQPLHAMCNRTCM